MRDEHFEWDDEKSKINKAKHGIDFEEARTLWSSGVDEREKYEAEKKATRKKSAT